jgi:hypothetical protein
MAEHGFAFESTSLSVDGGNLLKLDDGTCLTTNGLFRHNTATQSSLVSEMRRVFRCNDVVLLEPMPGKYVIDHVDMFVLPPGQDGSSAQLFA